MEHIFDVLVENALNERMDSLVKDDEILCKCDCEFDLLSEKFNEMLIKEEDRKIISCMFDILSEHAARYAELAYRQAMFDVGELLRGMKIIPEMPI